MTDEREFFVIEKVVCPHCERRQPPRPFCHHCYAMGVIEKQVPLQEALATLGIKRHCRRRGVHVTE